MASPRDWDAASYQRVSVPHEEWARSVLDRLELTGAETVLDAGCGSGRVTSMLIERLPEGRVVAVDGSPSMVEKVGEVLRPQDEARVADLAELELEEPVDAVFSSAVFHWVLDHDALFRSLRAALRPGGRVAAQCGGAGNIERLREVTREVQERAPYASYFAGFEEPWNYAGTEETEARLERAGFAEMRSWLQPWQILPPSPAEFLGTVCLGPHVDRLPESLRDRFVADVLAEESEPLALDYVRLNIEARAPRLSALAPGRD
jgi:trans-aconitate 2-methyltransferase